MLLTSTDKIYNHPLAKWYYFEIKRKINLTKINPILEYDLFAEKNIRDLRFERILGIYEYRVHVARNSIKSSSNLTFLAQYIWKM